MKETIQEKSVSEMLQQLCGISAVCGFQPQGAEYVRQLLDAICDTTEIDRLGNVIGIRRCGKPNAKLILLDAHIDQIGFVVTEVLANGFVRFAAVGGVDPRMLLGCRVLIETKEGQVPGMISCTPPHLLKSGDEATAVPIHEMVIDTGLLDARAQVSVGMPIRFVPRFMKLQSEAVAAPSLDDRAGIASIVAALRLLREESLSVDVAVVASVQEEVTSLGAQTMSFRLQPDYAIAVDVSHAKTPDSSADDTFAFGGGVMIGMGPNCNAALTNHLIETAKQQEMPYQIEVMEGSSGTNAWEMQISGRGSATAILSIPLRYMHTPIETIRLSDVDSVATLLYHFLKDFDAEARK